MARQTSFHLSWLLILSITISIVEGKNQLGHGSLKLFVFGDSYADTGNWRKSISISWREPYGISYPGKPSGRFSDGRVLTDYIASFLGVQSPIPYEWREIEKKFLQYGMNFAYGGTGVFNTFVNEPNMTTQINYFQHLLEENVYTKQDLNSSIALVSLGGNDYGTYLAGNGTMQDFSAIITKVVNQVALNLKRINDFGVGKIAVTAIEPIGCLPQFTAVKSYSNCSEIGNSIAKLHNELLHQTVRNLNNKSKKSSFLVLDLYSSFMSAWKSGGKHQGSLKFENPFKPCCTGMGSTDYCGSIDKGSGMKKYVVCKNPELAFYWDTVHPSQSGWRAVYLALKPSLHQLY